MTACTFPHALEMCFATMHGNNANIFRNMSLMRKYSIFVFTVAAWILLWYILYTYLDTWILGVASKQLRLLRGRVGDSTTVVNSLSPQMSELVEDAIAS